MNAEQAAAFVYSLTSTTSESDDAEYLSPHAVTHLMAVLGVRSIPSGGDILSYLNPNLNGAAKEGVARRVEPFLGYLEEFLQVFGRPRQQKPARPTPVKSNDIFPASFPKCFINKEEHRLMALVFCRDLTPWFAVVHKPNTPLDHLDEYDFDVPEGGKHIRYHCSGSAGKVELQGHEGMFYWAARGVDIEWEGDVVQMTRFLTLPKELHDPFKGYKEGQL